ncbi:unnamed protein product, partial [Closterium sp. NIES-54]
SIVPSERCTCSAAMPAPSSQPGKTLQCTNSEPSNLAFYQQRTSFTPTDLLLSIPSERCTCSAARPAPASQPGQLLPPLLAPPPPPPSSPASDAPPAPPAPAPASAAPLSSHSLRSACSPSPPPRPPVDGGRLKGVRMEG